MKKKTEDCSHRTLSNPIQSMDGSNPCPTLTCMRVPILLNLANSNIYCY